jgi:hypothetical protein
MLQNGHLRLQSFHFHADADPAYNFDADPDLAFQFDADLDPDPAFHSDADPDPASQNDADPDPQHCLEPKTYQVNNSFKKLKYFRLRNVFTGLESEAKRPGGSYSGPSSTSL